MKHSRDELLHFLGTSQEKTMATNYNEKKRIVESMIKEERILRFACELGSPFAVKVSMKQNTLIVFTPFVFLVPGVGFQTLSSSA